MGASVPVAADFQEALAPKMIVSGFLLPGDNFHSPDEHFALGQLHGGVDMLVRLCVRAGRPWLRRGQSALTRAPGEGPQEVRHRAHQRAVGRLLPGVLHRRQMLVHDLLDALVIGRADRGQRALVDVDHPTRDRALVHR